MPPVIHADRLTKYYGRRCAVNDVSFEVASGEVLGLLGPNGSGKSTILRMLTGYLRPSAGRVRVAGFDVASEGLQARRRIGYVPEDVPLYTHMRVAEFLSFMGRLQGLEGRALEAAIANAVAKLALGGVRELTINKLSRGFRQRVAIAQALLHGPELLILDEPTNGLDPRQIIEVRELIRALAAEHTILVTSHILSEIERVATRVAILLDGRLLSVNTLTRGGESLQVAARGDAGLLERTLAAVPGVTALGTPVAGSDGAWRCTVVVERGAIAGRIAAAVVGAGLELLALGPEQGRLEALFLELTGGAR
ncbi:MAG: ABC transporter ATP-binding protein [Gammaproteobacteria bacterium]|nr:ABC transporter ATP-binding protein [Gammaproteobacteria bacterium]MBI5614650.1 ABC transporter ATP-binding protein [Gammaproteobacteria bacterium]